MGKSKGGKNTFHGKEEKLALVKRNLEGETAIALERETGIYHVQIRFHADTVLLSRATPALETAALRNRGKV